MADSDKEQASNDASSLEQSGTSVQGGQPAVIDTSASTDSDTLSGESEGSSSPAAGAAPPPPPKSPIGGLAGKLNVYMLGFVLLLIVAGMTATILYLKAKSENTTNNALSSQSLSQS